MVTKNTIRFILVTIVLVINALLGTYLYFKQKQEPTTLNDVLRKNAPGKFVNLKYGPVHYLLKGNKSSPLLIFIHGGGITGMEVWKENVSFFSDHGYRVLAFDLYGRGFSARPDIDHSPKLYRDQLVELLAALNIKGSFDVVALSMGAIPGLDVYRLFPDRVKQLILIDPIASGSFEPNPLLKLPVVSDFLVTTYWYPQTIENQRSEFVNQSLFDSYSQRLKFFRDIKGFKKTNYSTWMNVLTQNKTEILKKIPSEDVMIIYGDKDPYFGKGQLHLYSKISPGIKLVKIEGTGHMPQYEKPEIVNGLIYEFLSLKS